MNGYLEVGILEVNQEHEVPSPDRLQQQRNCLQLEFSEGDVPVQTRQVDQRMLPPSLPSAPETTGPGWSITSYVSFSIIVSTS